MEEYTQITLDQWMQWKEDIRKKLNETANNFVYIGYRLKQIRDSGMYDGAEDIFEFAQKEYGLGKSTVSRFIAINEKYSEGGNSLELREEFKSFSSSKLSEMLTLPESEIQLITEKTTISEIRALKQFDREQPATEEPEHQKYSPLEKCLIDFFESRKEILKDVMGYLEMDPPEYKVAAEIMNPSGQSSHKKGIVFLFMYDWSIGVKYKMLTHPEPISMSWEELLNNIFNIFGHCNPANVWADFYGKTAENQGFEESVATSQQEEKSEEKTVEITTEDEPAKEEKQEDEENILNDMERGIINTFSEKGSQSDAEVEPEEKALSEPEGTEMIDETFGSRKEYMDSLTEADMALYLNSQYMKGNLTERILSNASELLKWIKAEVDFFGNNAEGYLTR